MNSFQQCLKTYCFALSGLMIFISLVCLMDSYAPASPEINSDESTWSIGINSAHAKPSSKGKKKRKKKSYDKRQRAAKRLLEAGHPSVTITLKTDPRVRARVYHGKEVLGTTPLTLTWPKDTGPIDISLRASGYLRVNSRLYTHRDDRVTVKMFKEDQAHLLFGYRKKVKSKEDEAEGESGQ